MKAEINGMEMNTNKWIKNEYARVGQYPKCRLIINAENVETLI